jgi:hypothetical protein
MRNRAIRPTKVCSANGSIVRIIVLRGDENRSAVFTSAALKALFEFPPVYPAMSVFFARFFFFFFFCFFFLSVQMGGPKPF